MCPFAHVQRERFLTVSIFSKRDAVLFGKLIYIGQIKGLFAGDEHFNAVYKRPGTGILVGQNVIQRQRVVIGHHKVDARTAVHQIVILVIDNDVISRTAEEEILSFSTGEVVISFHPEQKVIAGTAEELIVAAIPCTFHSINKLCKSILIIGGTFYGLNDVRGVTPFGNAQDAPYLA